MDLDSGLGSPSQGLAVGRVDVIGRGDRVRVGALYDVEKRGTLSGLAPCDQMFEMATSALGHGIGKARRSILAERDALDFDPAGLVMIRMTRESEVEARALENRDLAIDLRVAREGRIRPGLIDATS